jgi:hypothetical protein
MTVMACQLGRDENHPQTKPQPVCCAPAVCNLIPSSLVPKLARETGVEKKARTFSPWSHLLSLVSAQLPHALGLNEVWDGWRRHRGLLVTLRGATPPSRNNLSPARKERDASLAEKVFCAVLGHRQNLPPAFARGHRGQGIARRFPPRPSRRGFDHDLGWSPPAWTGGPNTAGARRAAKCHLRLDLHSFLPRFAIYTKLSYILDDSILEEALT